MPVRSASIRLRLLIAAHLSVLPLAAAHCSGTATLLGSSPGRTAFIANVHGAVSGPTLASVEYGIVPKANSLVVPLISGYSASYLTQHSDLVGDKITIPVWGLFAGTTNIVAFMFSFTDGSSVVSLLPITTAAYTDPCGPINAPVLTQNRTSANDIGFNYFLLKDFCSPNSPAIVDTDGNLRWVGTAHVNSIPAILFDNAIYTSDTHTGINRMELTGQVSKVADFASAGGGFTGQHNMDPGRDGIVVEEDTTTETESVALEFDATSGQILNTWDMGQILTEAMLAGGDNPAQFVGPNGTDWFHMNATAYDAGDGTEVISSRENFVIDVDYDTPPDGVKKIHWILGDTTKKWFTFPSLAKYALALAPGGLPPIGQHAISFDHRGNLLLFDDGHNSDYEFPYGLDRGFSAGRSYAIDTAAMTATEVLNYTPNPPIYADFCGSIYEQTPDNYLIDFATAANDTQADLQGLGAALNVVFDLQIAQTAATDTCGAGWNAVPLPNTPILFP